MKRLFSIVAVAVLSLSSFSRAAEHGMIGIGGETTLLLEDISGSSPVLNFRVAPSEIFAADLYLGFQSTSGPGDFSEFDFRFGVGGLVNVLYGKQADLGVYLRYSGIADNNFLSVDESYTRFTSVISTGFEPAYYFNNYFSAYFRTGISLAIIPDGKAIVEGDVIDMEDGKTIIGTNGIAIGLRYYFGG